MRGILWAAAGTTEIVCSPSPAPAVAITTPWLSLSGPDWLYTNIGSIAMYRLQAIVIGTQVFTAHAYTYMVERKNIRRLQLPQGAREDGVGAEAAAAVGAGCVGVLYFLPDAGPHRCAQRRRAVRPICPPPLPPSPRD